MNSTILHLIKKNNTLRMKIERSSSPSEYLRNKYKGLRSRIKQMLRESRLSYMMKICECGNSKRLWSCFIWTSHLKI